MRGENYRDLLSELHIICGCGCCDTVSKSSETDTTEHMHRWANTVEHMHRWTDTIERMHGSADTVEHMHGWTSEYNMQL